MRIAIISTPRSGNTWLRKLLAHLYAVPEWAVHCIHGREWDDLPDECLLQLHWPREPDFADELARRGFRVVALCRHPFDVLISILHFAINAQDTHHWLEGAGGNERGIFGAMPRSRAFLDYATGPRGRALLGVSPQWAARPGDLSVRYEDLVAAPADTLAHLVEAIGPPHHGTIAEAITATTLPKLRTTSSNRHFWQGQPGLWRQLLPVVETAELVAGLGDLVGSMGYATDADPTLTAAVADARWLELVGPELASSIRRERELAEQLKLTWNHAHLLEIERTALYAEQARLREQVAAFERLGPLTLRIAARIRTTSDRIPSLVQFTRWLLRV